MRPASLARPYTSSMSHTNANRSVEWIRAKLNELPHR